MGFKPGNNCVRYKKNVNWESLDKINKTDLERMYIEEQMTITEISITYNCSPGTISKRLRKYEIPTRPPAPRVGHTVSEETRRKISDTLVERFKDPTERKRLSRQAKKYHQDNYDPNEHVPPEAKTCSCCGEVKIIDNYPKSKSGKDGYAGQCRRCLNNKSNERKKKYRTQDEYVLKEKEYKQSEKYKAYCKEYRQKIYSTPEGVINRRMRAGMRNSLKGNKNGMKWESLVGYTCEDLRVHLENLFTDGMSWEKFMNGEIHIDHKKPVSSFNFNSYEDEEFKQCWALENLQPLWAKDNLSKWNKLDWEGVDRRGR